MEVTFNQPITVWKIELKQRNLIVDRIQSLTVQGDDDEVLISGIDKAVISSEYQQDAPWQWLDMTSPMTTTRLRFIVEQVYDYSVCNVAAQFRVYGQPAATSAPPT